MASGRADVCGCESMAMSSAHRDATGNARGAAKVLTQINVLCDFALFIGNVPIGVQRVLTLYNMTAITNAGGGLLPVSGISADGRAFLGAL